MPAPAANRRRFYGLPRAASGPRNDRGLAGDTTPGTLEVFRTRGPHFERTPIHEVRSAMALSIGAVGIAAIRCVPRIGARGDWLHPPTTAGRDRPRFHWHPGKTGPGSRYGPRLYGSLAQWQRCRLITGWLLVRVQDDPPALTGSINSSGTLERRGRGHGPGNMGALHNRQCSMSGPCKRRFESGSSNHTRNKRM